MLFLGLLFFSGCRTEVFPREGPRVRHPERALNLLLAEVVDEDGYVDYQALQQNRDPLDRYVDFLRKRTAVPKSKERSAFYLNAYNMLVLFLVLEEGIPDSVKSVEGGIWPVSGFFRNRVFKIGQSRLSLWELEQERIRNRHYDYRIHASLNHATKSSPPLRNELYSHERLEEQLTDQMEKWLGDPLRGWRIEDETLVLNPIFDWYTRDFTFWAPEFDDLCSLVAHHVEPPQKEALKALSDKGCPLTFFEFDWTLNAAVPAADPPPL